MEGNGLLQAVSSLFCSFRSNELLFRDSGDMTTLLVSSNLARLSVLPVLPCLSLFVLVRVSLREKHLEERYRQGACLHQGR